MRREIPACLQHLALWRFPKPVLAAVNGLRRGQRPRRGGGGFDLALLCDQVLHARQAARQ